MNAIVAARMQTRRDHILKTCKSLPKEGTQDCDVPKIKETLKHVPDRKLIYCSIEKTGSTFWKRILHVIGGWGNTTNPMDILTADADTKNGGFKTMKNHSMTEVKRVVGNSTNIMFVRDPFTRLFSGWLDKFYSTNPYYWNLLGREIIKQQRKNATAVSKTCGHDVTFSEFLIYVVKVLNSSACLDMHFQPSQKHCLPCTFNYDYVGKYETLREDTLFLKDHLNLKITFSDFEKDSHYDAIRDAALWVYQQKPGIVKCMPFGCGLFRVWKRLQSRGFLSKKAEFPFRSNQHADNTSEEEFQRILLKEYSETDMTETKNNRHEALAEAYQSLRLVDLNRMITAFHLDFQLFEYETKPDFLNHQLHENLSYFKECPYSFHDP